jgi:hypothetical protein
MSSSFSAVSQTLRSISLTKNREIEKQRDKYESQKNEVLAAADEHPNDIRKRIKELLKGASALCDVGLRVERPASNIDFWLRQSSYDASIPYQKLQSYETFLRSKLEVQSRKLGLAHLYSRLITEWMDPSTSPISGAPVSGDEESLAVIDPQKERLQELCDEFEEIVFTPLETDEARIEDYLRNMFSGEQASSLESLRSSVADDEQQLLVERKPFDQDTVRWCVNGLLSEDLLSEEKQAILREFLANPTVLNEIADVLNIRFADFDNWSWEAGEQGIPVLPRQQLNGKYRIWMDEDVLQAIFIHYIGIKNCVDLKARLIELVESEEGPWKWSTMDTWNSIERFRYEFFCGKTTQADDNLNAKRSSLYRESFFISQLPESVTTIGKNWAYVKDEDPEDDDEVRPKSPKERENVNIKQKLLRSLAAEAIVHRTLNGEAVVIQSDLKQYATGLSHTTIFAVMRFVGFSERLISFYKKMLQAPLNMVSTQGDTPTGEPRIRQRGVPMAHAPEKFTGELILFMMDLAVNKATGMYLYRLHDDLFLCGEPSRCAQAWKAMQEFTQVMGLEFNESKTGSAYLISPEKTRDSQVHASLPEGRVRIGHLLLDQDTGEWVLDEDQIEEHIMHLQKQLNACTSILDWVTTWNSCINRFFSHTLGEPAFCFGHKHVDSVLQIHQKIQRTLFQNLSKQGVGEGQQEAEGNIVDYLKSKLEERFGVTGIPDAFIFLPESLGGLGVKNPFIPYSSHSFPYWASSPDRIMAKFGESRHSYRPHHVQLAPPAPPAFPHVNSNHVKQMTFLTYNL